MDPREFACRCGAFILKTTAPYGWTRAWCRSCKKWSTIEIGSPPQEVHALAESAA